jgi:hypothetical protein
MRVHSFWPHFVRHLTLQSTSGGGRGKSRDQFFYKKTIDFIEWNDTFLYER